VGSGPAGLACAAQLNKAGQQRPPLERATKSAACSPTASAVQAGKGSLFRRVKLLEEEGITFVNQRHRRCKREVEDLRRDFDAIVLTGGSTHGRDLPVPAAS